MTSEELPRCVGCRGRRIVPGRFVSSTSSTQWHRAPFRWNLPKGQWGQFFASIGIGRARLLGVRDDAFLCLDCGTAWTSIDREIAESEIRNRADDETKRRLGLAEKSIPLDDEIA